MRVELRAVSRQIFVLFFGIGYAGVHVEKALLAKHVFERVVEEPAESAAENNRTDENGYAQQNETEKSYAGREWSGPA